MDEARFWQLVAHTVQGHVDWESRSQWLVATLSRLTPDEIVGFEVRFAAVAARAMTWRMWGAAHRILGWCSDDGFTDFRAWLVGLGPDTFERVIQDPDELAELPWVRALAQRPSRDWAEPEWPAWESLSYAAARAYERRTGDECAFHEMCEARAERETETEPKTETLTDDNWDFDDPIESARRLPRLTALFPTTERRRQRDFDEELASQGMTPAAFYFGPGTQSASRSESVAGPRSARITTTFRPRGPLPG